MKILNWCWHKWGRWSAPHNGILAENDSSTGYFKVCQMRECEKCGLAEIRKLPKLRSLEELRRER